jgi:hypothetical protein
MSVLPGREVAEWLATVARLVLGVVWVVAGAVKLPDPAEAVRADRAVHEAIVQLRFADWTVRATDQASRAGVTATPTVLIKGSEVTDPSPAEIIAAVQSATAA